MLSHGTQQREPCTLSDPNKKQTNQHKSPTGFPLRVKHSTQRFKVTAILFKVIFIFDFYHHCPLPGNVLQH